MHEIITATLITVLIIIIAFLIKWSLDSFNLKTVTYNGGTYQVRKNYSNSEHAVFILDEINMRLLKFFKYLKNKYKINTTYGSETPEQTERRYIVERILINYNPEVLIENDPAIDNGTSYTVSKGREVHMCVRKKEQPIQFHTIDELVYVLLHEISHIGNPGWDIDSHNKRFWRIFKFILIEAKAAGIHNPVNYKKHPITYCGLFVNYNPYFDDNIASL